MAEAYDVGFRLKKTCLSLRDRAFPIRSAADFLVILRQLTDNLVASMQSDISSWPRSGDLFYLTGPGGYAYPEKNKEDLLPHGNSFAGQN